MINIDLLRQVLMPLKVYVVFLKQRMIFFFVKEKKRYLKTHCDGCFGWSLLGHFFDNALDWGELFFYLISDVSI